MSYFDDQEFYPENEECQRATHKDGWSLKEVGGTPGVVLAFTTTSAFPSAAKVRRHIVAEAIRGNNLHRKALKFLLYHSPEEYARFHKFVPNYFSTRLDSRWFTNFVVEGLPSRSDDVSQIIHDWEATLPDATVAEKIRISNAAKTITTPYEVEKDEGCKNVAAPEEVRRHRHSFAYMMDVGPIIVSLNIQRVREAKPGADADILVSLGRLLGRTLLAISPYCAPRPCS